MINKQTVYSRIALFSAALIWGSSFFIVKNSVEVFQPFTLMSIRFVVAFIVMSLIFYKSYKNISKSHVIRGMIMGGFLFAAQATQTVGILTTTPGKNAFLTTIYCVIVPFLHWFVDKKKPDTSNAVAGMLCLVGLGLVSLNESFNIKIGDTLTIISGILYAGHIVSVEKSGRNHDIILLTVLQMGTTAVCSVVCCLIFEKFPGSVDLSTGLSVAYLALGVTMLAFLLQNIGQKNTNPSEASIILCLESVFGVLFSIIFYGEILTIRLFIGFVIIFIAIILSETKLKFFIRVENEIENDEPSY